MIFLSFLLFTLCLLSLWIRKDPRIWITLLVSCFIIGWFTGLIQFVGLLLAFVLATLWIVYINQKKAPLEFLLFIAIVLFSLIFQFRVFPQFSVFTFSSQFKIGFSRPLIGIFPLAFFVPLARSLNDWKIAVKGTFWGFLVIVVIAIAASTNGVVYWQVKIPSFALIRYWSNLFLTSIPEEGFFRGFIQTRLVSLFQRYKWGKWAALFITTIIFTLTHIYWSPNLATLIFVFFAGLLYGGVYLYSRKIESAIITHFLLNFIHMTFFSYHAM